MDCGRPSKYKEEFVQIAIDYLGQGKSVTQLATHLRVHKDTVYQWAKDHKTFSDALKIGKQDSQAVWEEKLESMMFSKEVNAPLVKLYFANRFGWHDKQEVSGNKDAPLQIVVKSTALAEFDPE